MMPDYICINCRRYMQYQVGVWICPQCGYTTTFSSEEY